MSDMAPNITGNRAMDQPRSMALLDEALAFAEEALKPGGDLLVKAFQGEGIDELVSQVAGAFQVGETPRNQRLPGLKAARFIC